LPAVPTGCPALCQVTLRAGGKDQRGHVPEAARRALHGWLRPRMVVISLDREDWPTMLIHGWKSAPARGSGQQRMLGPGLRRRPGLHHGPVP
jgi:hypothetical protein